MTVECIPKFTTPTASLWADRDGKKLQLSNVRCSKFGHAATITNFSDVVKTGYLLLVGKCSECREDIASVISISLWVEKALGERQLW